MQEVRQRAILDPDDRGMERVSDSINIGELSAVAMSLVSAAKFVSHAQQIDSIPASYYFTN